MKKLVVLIGLMAVVSLMKLDGMTVTEFNAPGKDTVHVMVSPELSDLVDKWVKEYAVTGTDIIIRKENISDAGTVYNLRDKGVIGIVTEDYLHSMQNESLWSMVVARDVIVPVVSSENPFSEVINTRGLSPGQFAGVYTEPGSLTWGKVLDNDNSTTVNCYCLADNALKGCLAEFLQADNLRANVTKAADNDELIQSIIRDKYSIGFCRLSSVIDYENHSIREGLMIVPVDINGNGVLEHNENIYRCLNDFNRGIWIGKYPGSLCRNIHVISSRAPIAVNETDFVQWLLSGGQAYISEAGFSELIPGERQPKIQALNGTETAAVIERGEQPVKAATILFVAGTILIAGFLVYVIVKLVRAGSTEPEKVRAGRVPVFNDKNTDAPDGLFFDKTHTWAFMEKDGKVRLGVDDFLQHITGNVTKIKMKEPGTKIKKGDIIVSLAQNGKQLDIYSPVSGEITESNSQLASDSSIINTAPYSEGWIYTVKPDNWMKETRKYMLGDDYREFLKSEFVRLKDFVAVTVKSDEASYSKVILQDGGEIKDGMLEGFGPDVWEEFQRGFIDTSA